MIASYRIFGDMRRENNVTISIKLHICIFKSSLTRTKCIGSATFVLNGRMSVITEKEFCLYKLRRGMSNGSDEYFDPGGGREAFSYLLTHSSYISSCHKIDITGSADA